MNIDNPIRAAKQVIRADERQLTSEFVNKAEKILGIMLPPAAPFSHALESFVNKRKQENHDLLFQTVVEEVEKLLDRELKFSDDHKRWIREELTGLLLEGLNRAEQTRYRDRIIRLAKVIRHAISVGPAQPAEIATEMMRVVTELSEQDVTALNLMYKSQSDSIRHRAGRPEINEANSTWAQLEKQHEFFRSGADVYSTCLKLQSFGLIMAMERIATILGLQSMPYALLPKGIQFIEYVKDEEAL
ncbi:MAG TPA: hypothetical protein VKT33_05820 [Candidatus Angelobacter sp.]|nr:hypothetical protein [Candidatus Angelobacter sp.]